MATGTRVTAEPRAVAACRGLTHRYGDRVVHADLDFTLTTGVTGLVGVNGAGKTTLMHVLATVLRPTAGRVELASLAGTPDATDLLAVRRRVALAPQSFVPPRSMRVEEYLTLMAWMRGLRRSSWRDEVTRVLSEVELVDRRRDRFSALSGGMVQRVNLAQALLGDPDLLLLDEPLSGLDPEQRIRIRELVARIGQLHAVLVSTHVMDDVVPVAARVLMLDGGGLAFDGSPAELAAIGARSVTADSVISPYEAAFLALRNGEQR